eukprot:gnl/TRDRNA2_/TRDRNA2_189824_c0_seq1.p1 gnl/TRDRNA2_/TRDRNA2_189824_c0~~gnl/TRDRNA2_/TRDRNA2_189824_c0_seq1.p1  ORF type:complete len:235 (+),score=25.10 gnl/TRDRNA2_/TRDRNA2_189824_c0_seq1:64-768(+)
MCGLPAEQEKQEEEVLPSCVRIDGSFCGAITTATHYIEISLDLDYDVPMTAISPAVRAFAEAAKENDSRGSTRELASAEVWNQLHDIISGKDGSDAAMEVSSEIDLTTLGEMGLEAKDALIRSLVYERDKLSLENALLRAVSKEAISKEAASDATSSTDSQRTNASVWQRINALRVRSILHRGTGGEGPLQTDEGSRAEKISTRLRAQRTCRSWVDASQARCKKVRHMMPSAWQ